ncbi:MAG: glycine--tRNA ligase subunit beta [Vicinamibacteria bacterium]|nr:glycine--tRNA ligase subunit beta [Vicinamibacteria bacterium]
MDRELLIEIGVEEVPASWLPSLTTQLADVASAQLRAARLNVDGPVESWTTPRRLTVRVHRVAERQTDLEEVLNGPPVSAARGADGQFTPSAIGFARKNGVDPEALEEIDTPKGRYLAVRKRQRGKASVDALPDVMTGLLRGLAFPKSMNWDAWLDDGKGDFRFGRPVRWLLFLYGGRVVPYDIRRAESAQSPLVQDVRSGATTYGHRFLTTSGRAGRAVKVKTFDDYKARLLEHFVVLEREDRRERIARDLEVHAVRLGGRVHRAAAGQAGLLDEVPDLVEWPSVVAGVFPAEFLALPEEVLTTTMIHHQHYFPVVDDQGRLKAAFLAVTNVEVEKPELISRNSERVLTARLRDAQFFWNADRKVTLEDRIGRLDTILFHKKLGSYKAKAERVERLAEWIAREALAKPAEAASAAKAGRLAKADLGTDLVREFTELQGTMGGIYAREEGLPEAVWKAIYYHYLPVAVEPEAPPTRAQLGAGAICWAAVSIADKLDTLVGLFSAGERPTGSRDPYGLRRQAHGLFRTLVDLPDLTGLSVRPTVGALIAAVQRELPLDEVARTALTAFLAERLTYVLEQRGYDVRNVRAVLAGRPLGQISPLEARRMLEVLPEFTGTPEFQQLATAFKRVKNIASGELGPGPGAITTGPGPVSDPYSVLHEPAELALVAELTRRQPVIERVLDSGDHYRQAFAEAAAFGPFVDRFFADVFVMVEDPALRQARLHLMASLSRLILRLADISEIVPQSES